MDRILDFLRRGQTGQVSLNIHNGKILNADLREKVLPDDERPVVESPKNRSN